MEEGRSGESNEEGRRKDGRQGKEEDRGWRGSERTQRVIGKHAEEHGYFCTKLLY